MIEDPIGIGELICLVEEEVNCDNKFTYTLVYAVAEKVVTNFMKKNVSVGKLGREKPGILKARLL